MTARSVDVVVIGGGISGLALAFELRRRRALQIVLLERTHVGAGDSSRNVGRIRAMQLTADLARIALLAQRKHERLTDDLKRNTLFWRAGYAWVLYDDAEVERMTSIFPSLRDAGVRTPRLVTGRAIARTLPVLHGGEPPAAAIIGDDAIGHHDAVLFAYRAACDRMGVELVEDAPVLDLLRDGDRVTGVETARETIRADHVVNAAGGWAPAIARMAGLDIPTLPVRREVFVTEPAAPFMSPAITFYRPVEGWFNQTLRGELVAGVVDAEEPPGMNYESSFGFLRRTGRVVVAKAPRLGHLRVIRQWAGIYDMTPDRMPLVGPVDGARGLVQLNGYNGRGFALAPFLAEELARWLVDDRRPDVLAPFDPNRFDGRETHVVLGDYYAGYAEKDRGRG
jgi:sarcosine oxidase, subunit beta